MQRASTAAGVWGMGQPMRFEWPLRRRELPHDVASPAPCAQRPRPDTLVPCLWL